DSTGFIQGKGRTYTLAVAIARSSINTTYTPSPAVAPGFFNVAFSCPATTDSGNSGLIVSNLAGSDENMFLRNDVFPNVASAPIASDSSVIVATERDGDLTTA